MIDDVDVELDGRRYRWTYDPHVASAESCWSWSDDQTYMTPPGHVIERLNRLFIETRAKEIAGSIDDDRDFERLHDVLRSMGASDADFNADFLLACVEAADPPLAQEMQFETLPPPAHSPFNCRELRDWFCWIDTPQEHRGRYAICIGEGPFEQHEFLPFILVRGVIPLVYPESQPALESLGAWGIAVIGRDKWLESDIDDLIEDHRGKSLRVYSQEMFVAKLASGRDPFDAASPVLSAFRAGHPALEFVSQGWPGWVSTWVPYEKSQRTSRTMPGNNWRQESPLHVLGYRVGQHGLPKSERRAILRAAFEGELPKVGDARYMAEWGDAKSGARLKKLANFLASNCRNQKKKERRSEEAIEDWEGDLNWLEQTFYQGHFTFHWPDTFV